MDIEDLVAVYNEVTDACLALVLGQQRPSTGRDRLGDLVRRDAESADTQDIVLECDGERIHLVPVVRDGGQVLLYDAAVTAAKVGRDAGLVREAS